VSEQILNDTSTQLGYTVPLTSVHARKYGTEDKSKTDTTKTKHNPEKANTKHRKTKLPWFSRFLRHSARKRGGLILQHSRAHMGLIPYERAVMFTLYCILAVKQQIHVITNQHWDKSSDLQAKSLSRLSIAQRQIQHYTMYCAMNAKKHCKIELPSRTATQHCV